MSHFAVRVANDHSSGSLAIFAILRASSLSRNLAAVCRQSSATPSSH